MFIQKIVNPDTYIGDRVVRIFEVPLCISTVNVKHAWVGQAICNAWLHYTTIVYPIHIGTSDIIVDPVHIGTSDIIVDPVHIGTSDISSSYRCVINVARYFP